MSLMAFDHAVIRVQDLDAARRWYCDLLGLIELGRDGDLVYLGCGGDEHVDLGLRPGGVGLDHMAFSVASLAALEQVRQQYLERGIDCSAIEHRPEPGIAAAFRLATPTEQVFEVVVRDGRTSYPHTLKWNPAAAHAPLDINHITFLADDVETPTRFYCDQLGFAFSDLLLPPDAERPWLFSFIRVGENHHDIAIVKGSVGNKLHHVAFLVNGVSEVVRFADRLGRYGWRIEAGVGRHGPGGNSFLYVRDPSGNRIEITADVARLPNREEPPRIWRGELSAVFNVWTETPPPASFGEGT
ncbi:MAG: VOC family protein [Thermomicrobium sp.]|nr:VOC family protein [Thermomicrobium sp.]